MGWRPDRGDHRITSPSIQETPFVMTFPAAEPQARFPVRRLSQHEIVIARFAVAHDNGFHVSPRLGCYKCMHGETPAFFPLRKAA